jgi:hypothetical protein
MIFKREKMDPNRDVLENGCSVNLCLPHNGRLAKHSCQGCAIAQAVRRWLPTAAARVRARVWSSGICGGQSGAGAGFLRVLRFALQIFIPPNSPSSQSPGAGTIGQKWPTCQVDPGWTQPPPTMRLIFKT